MYRLREMKSACGRNFWPGGSMQRGSLKLPNKLDVLKSFSGVTGLLLACYTQMEPA